ncbi:peptide chain release factor 2 [Treponema parvum]|uniref:Peptide chain release factor 2 n=1 Tax=Treponema parvum TaxID=138851 RepID=A0A975F0B0_9SPIR|nr:peptide chain release factor 2 [Treponema parvum]QTQ12038.1 peptide chain release factor 2 [Treponema parvum]QTQ15986.1 peptide chain release factor 2 [Treponema parvum]
MLEELKTPITELKEDIMNVWGRLDPASIEKKIAEKEAQTTAENFWEDQQKAQQVMNEIKLLKGRVEPWKKLVSDINDIEALYELGEESKDESVEEELKLMLNTAKEEFEHQSILNLLSGEVDKSSAFLTIHSGAGGTEAEDWAYMLSRMYIRWAERQGFKMETVDMLEAEGGIKSITIQINGDYVYGYLKGEAGIHRLVRISPFDANARRHTSFSSVFVFPVLDDSINVEIKPEDLRIDTYRAGGKGGQHVNKTDSAVRFTHLPTGIVVACQSERSQIMNRQTAMSILKSKLYAYYKEQKEKENSKYGAEKKDISWGNQIRSYVFQPYTLVKDHRTKYETGNIQAVMDGDITQFIDSFLNAQWKGLPMGTGEDDDDLK